MLLFLVQNRPALELAISKTTSVHKFIFNIIAASGSPNPDILKIQHPSIILNIGNMFNTLAVVLTDSLDPDVSVQLESQVTLSLKILAKKWVAASCHQINPLSQALNTVLNIAKSFSAGGARFLILELPIGNTIPTRALESIFEKEGLLFELLRISLNRNDKSNVGLTRADILKEKLNEFKLDKNTVIIYIDEWVTGSNFNTITKILEKFATEKSVFLIPVALQVKDAEREVRYNSYQKFHNSLTKKIGHSGDQLRIIFPALGPEEENDQRFFWTENDRLAGYRKMQHFGSVLSSIVEVVDELLVNDDSLKTAHSEIMRLLANEENINDKDWLTLTPKSFRDAIQENYSAFVDWKKEVITYKFQSNMGECSDTSDSMNEINTALSEKAENTKAKLPVLAALALIKVKEVNPRDQYYFKDHVPVVSELNNGLELLSEIFISELTLDIIHRIFPE
ncbi:hypothetical protein CIK05_11160 [Bdellovibrio sp. qaytius]|nr:hypothetical protein CIK05_11160 [Bdellovibrio sp. qaytius]